MISRDQNNRIIINADSMKRNSNDGSIVLKGNVQVIFGDHSLSCNEAVIHQKTQEIEATGGIYLASPSAIVSGDKATINYRNKTGTIYNGIIKMDQVIFEGEMIIKKGEKEFEAIKADYTACTTCPPAWNFTGSNISASYGGYAYIRSPILRVVRVPIFWLPYLIVPLNSKRQTGLLFPTYGLSSKSGFNISLPFFWAISESTDATLTAKHWVLRGTKGIANYRYVLTEESRGEADVGLIEDRLLSNDTYFKDKSEDGKKITRWHTKYKHTYVLPHDFVHRMDINAASDLRYSRDFYQEFQGWGDPALENRMSLTKNTETIHSSADAAIYVNQLKEEPLSNNLDAVHRFPELRLSMIPRRLWESPFLFNFDVNYDNFTRESRAFDDRVLSGNKLVPQTDPTASDYGVYSSSTDLIRTGQRTDMQPRISMPVSLGPYIDILPSATYRETHYQFPVKEQATAQRRLFRTDISARTHFSKIFSNSDNPRGNRYRHEIVPEITHTSIPWVQRQNHPFFGPSDEESFFTSNTALSDADENKQFDYHDRLYERNLFTFALSNYLIRKKWTDDKSEYSRIALFRLSQSYDYYESVRKTDPRQPYSDISALLDVRLDWFETNTLVRYYPYQNVTTSASRVRLVHPRKHYIEFNYSQDIQIIKGQSINLSNRTEDLITTAGVYFNQVGLEGKSQYSFVTHKFSNYGYLLTLKPPGDCWYIAFGQERKQDELLYTFTASFLFDGKTAVNPL